MRYEVIVSLKPEVLDPEGRAIHQTLTRLGYDAVQDVTVTKRFVIAVADGGGEGLVEEVAKKFLANPVSQTVEIRKLDR